jgi:hypothetical protein
MVFSPFKPRIKHLEFAALHLVFAIACLWIYPYFFELNYLETDFIEYCVSIESISDKRFPVAYKRSQFPGLLPWVFGQRYGLIDGLGLAAIFSATFTFSVLLFWLQRFSLPKIWNWALCLLCILQSPFVAYTRMFNFYPEITAICVFGMVAVAMALHTQKNAWIFFGYFGASLCWLSDARGLIWALPFTGLMFFQGWKDKQWLTHGLAFVGSNILSWKLGQFAFQKYSTPLLRQMDVRPLFDNVSPNNPLYQGPYDYPPDFIWGYSSILDLPATLFAIFQQTLIPAPPEFALKFPTMPETMAYWYFWLVLLLVSFIVIIKEKGFKFLLLLLPISPFVLVYLQIPSMVEPHVRFFSQCLPVFSIPIVIACSIFTKQIGQKSVLLFIAVTITLLKPLNIQWPISHVIMHHHLNGAFPEKSEYLKNIPNQSGQQIHLLVLPLTEREQRMGRKWLEICESRLRKDGVVQPFFETSSWIPK